LILNKAVESVFGLCAGAVGVIVCSPPYQSERCGSALCLGRKTC
jgi:hypothetical protein